jgi:hypothetical protein
MSFTGVIKNGVVVLPPEVHLAEGVKVTVEPLKLEARDDPFLATVERLARPRPDWPLDYVLNHGHYVSGEPKKS